MLNYHKEPFAPMFREVWDRLEPLPPLCTKIYVGILLEFPIEEDAESDPEWIIGYFQGSVKEISKRCKCNYTHLLEKLWKKFVSAGLLKKGENKTIIIPFYKKKEADYILLSDLSDTEANDVYGIKAQIAALTAKMKSINEVVFGSEITEGKDDSIKS